MEIHPDYKAGRPKRDEETILDMRSQQDIASWMSNIMGVANIRMSGVEADDIIAVLTKLHAKHGDAVTIATSDRDFLQLTKYSGVKFWDFGKRRELKPEVTPEKHALYKSMCGDPSDGIRGVRGYGPVRSKRLIDSGKPLEEELTAEQIAIIDRNLKLIDFDNIPKILEKEIVDEYVKILLKRRGVLKESSNRRGSFTNMCARYRMDSLMPNCVDRRYF